MNTRSFKYIIPALSLIFDVNFTSYLGNPGVTPIDPNLNVEFDQNTDFAKIYAELATTGNKGPDGQGDIADMDERASGLMCILLSLNELSTDKTICAWSGDVDVYPLNFAESTASNGVILNVFNRLYIQIAQCNNFSIQTEGKDDEESLAQRTEARLIHALDYYYLIDLYGNVPFAGENMGIDTYVPERITRVNPCTYMKKELKEVRPQMKASRANVYRRADQVVVQILLSRLYLNVETYTGIPQWSAAAEYSRKVMNADFFLASNYGDNFLAGNNTSPEVILLIRYDGVQTRSWSGLFSIASFISGDMNVLVGFGTRETWGGNRVRMALVKKFASDGNLSKIADTRASFWTTDCTFEINKSAEFTEGCSITKFKNITKSGQVGHDSSQQFPDMDFPLFRLAGTNLISAEATIRAGDDKQAVLGVINQLRKGARATEITATGLTLDFVLDEEAREFYFKVQCRTDLIHYNKFTSNYTWDWKGETVGDTSISSHFSLSPIPPTQLMINSNLRQNPGYQS